MADQKKASPEVVKAIKEAHGVLGSMVEKIEGGGEVDASALNDVIGKLMKVKGGYPSPKSKSMNPVEFMEYAKGELEKAAQEEPATRVGRLAQLRENMARAEKQFGSGQPAVAVDVVEGQPEGVTAPAPTSTDVNPLAAQSGAMATQFSQNLVKEIQEATARVAAALDKAKKKPEDEEEMGKAKKKPDEEEIKALETALDKAKKKEPQDEEAVKSLEALIAKAKKVDEEEAEEKGRKGKTDPTEEEKALKCPKCGYAGIPQKGGICPKCGEKMAKAVKKADDGLWPRDLTPMPHQSDDPTLGWGHDRRAVDRDWGTDPK